MRLTTVDMGYICLLMFVSVYKRPSSLQYCGDGHRAWSLDFAGALRFFGHGLGSMSIPEGDVVHLLLRFLLCLTPEHPARVN